MRKQIKRERGGTPIAGLEIATDTVANATKISPLATKNSGSVATLATKLLYDLDTNTLKPTLKLSL